MDAKVRKQQQDTIERLIRQRDRWRAMAEDQRARANYLEVEVRRLAADPTYELFSPGSF